MGDILQLALISQPNLSCWTLLLPCLTLQWESFEAPIESTWVWFVCLLFLSLHTLQIFFMSCALILWLCALTCVTQNVVFSSGRTALQMSRDLSIQLPRPDQNVSRSRSKTYPKRIAQTQPAGKSQSPQLISVTLHFLLGCWYGVYLSGDYSLERFWLLTLEFSIWPRKCPSNQKLFISWQVINLNHCNLLNDYT